MNINNWKEKKLERIAVVGSSCSGKTTLSAKLADILNIPQVELDALYWGPKWTINADFVKKATNAIQQKYWVMDGNYHKVKPLIQEKADLIVWLNYSFLVVMGRAIWRTCSRIFTREEIFSGNRETLFQSLLSSDSLLLWILKTYPKYKKEYGLLHRTYPNKVIVLKNQKETNVFLEKLRKLER